jgi:uncharacterized BrkB/YihY/UPF0761 family membrane protein
MSNDSHENNTFRHRVRDYAWMFGTIMVLYCAMAFSLVMGVYEYLFNRCEK